MSYILLAENCGGSHINFRRQNGEFYHQEVGKVYTGILALQTFEDRPYMRITFADGKNVWMGAAKKFFGIYSGIAKGNPLKAGKAADRDDYLCKFDFSKEDLRQGKKKIRYVLERNGSSYMPVFFCYDFSNDTGCSYLFPSSGVAEEWAKKIGLTTVEYLNENGKITKRKNLCWRD